MKTRLFITLVIFLGSYLTSAQGLYNMYPNYQPADENLIPYIAKKMYASKGEISPIMPLEVNGKGRQGTVRNKWPSHNKAIIKLYEIKVHKEGLLSIVAKPVAYDENGWLRLNVYGIDNRMEGGTIIRNLTNSWYDMHLRDDAYINDSYSFYAYPGTYYLTVVGKSGETPSKYLPLTYVVNVIQDDYVNSYSGNLGKDRGPYNPSVSYYPNDLGKTLLNDNSINVVSSLYLENWVRKPENNRLAKKSASTHDNSRDKFWFTPSSSGKVYFHLSSFSSEPMDVWQKAWRKQSKKGNSYKPLFRMMVMHESVKNHVLADKQSNFEGSMNVVAGGKYLVSVSSDINLPVYYRLYISYSSKVPPLNIGANNNTDNNQSTVDIYENIDIFDSSPDNNNQSSGNINELSEPFDASPNESRTNELNGIWGNTYIAFQINDNNASLFQTTEINYWQNYNIDIGGLLLKNIQKNGTNSWQCDVMWLFPNTSYVLWMTGTIEMSSDGNAITIIKKNPCDGKLGYQTLNRQIN